MKNVLKKIASVSLAVLLLAGASAALTGCFHRNVTPQDRYIEARNAFIDALSRGPWKLIPRAGKEGTKTDIEVGVGEGSDPIVISLYRASKGDDARCLYTAGYGDCSFSRCDERLAGETYRSYPGSVDGYLIMDGEMKEYTSSIGELYYVNSEGLLRVTNKFASPERIETADEEIEVDGGKAAAERLTLTLDEEALTEIRDSIIPDEVFSRFVENGEDPDGISGPGWLVPDGSDGNAAVKISFWQVRGVTRKAEISVSTDGYKATLSADVRSDVESVETDFSLAVEKDGEPVLGVPAHLTYEEKDGRFDWRFNIDASNAFAAVTDGTEAVGSGLYSPELTGVLMSSTGTYSDGAVDGRFSVEASIAGGEATRSFEFIFKAEKDGDGSIVFGITPDSGFPNGTGITGKTVSAEYTPGEYDPEDAIRFSEIEGEDKERFDRFAEELTDAMTRLRDAISGGLGFGFDPYGEEYMPFDLYLSGGDDEFYALNNYMSGYYSKRFETDFENGVASAETPDGTLILDLEERPGTVKIGDCNFTCSYEDLEDCVFAHVRREGADDLYTPSYLIALYDDPELADLTGAEIHITFDFEREGDGFICHFPDGDLTFTYHEGDGTVMINGAEFETSVYVYGQSD